MEPYSEDGSAWQGYVRDASGTFKEFSLFNGLTIVEVDALSINSKGVVVGHFRSPETQRFIAFKRAPSGGMTYLDPFGFGWSVGALDIGDDGVIVGFFYDAHDEGHGYLRLP